MPIETPEITVLSTEEALKQSQAALQLSEERFRLATASEAMTLYEQDAQLRYTWLYPNPDRYHGALGRSDLELMPGEEGEMLTRWKREVIATGVSARHEAKATRHGKVTYYDVLISPRRDAEGRVIGVAGTALDVTDRKKTELDYHEAQERLAKTNEELEQRVNQRTAELRETIADLEAFSYSVSHDMRAPLRSIQGFAAILDEEFSAKLGSSGKGYLERIATNATRMDRLILDVLAFSRAGRADPKLVPVDLGKVVRGVIEAYPYLQSPNAEVTIEGALPCVMANEAALGQCVTNLLGNAAKFVEGGTKPRIRIRADAEADRIVLYIQDNGIGIAKEAHERIFRIFERGAAGYEGNGIGLAIVRKAADRMGARIGLESEPGKGSTFSLSLQRPR